MYTSDYFILKEFAEVTVLLKVVHSMSTEISGGEENQKKAITFDQNCNHPNYYSSYILQKKSKKAWSPQAKIL